MLWPILIVIAVVVWLNWRLITPIVFLTITAVGLEQSSWAEGLADRSWAYATAASLLTMVLGLLSGSVLARFGRVRMAWLGLGVGAVSAVFAAVAAFNAPQLRGHSAYLYTAFFMAASLHLVLANAWATAVAARAARNSAPVPMQHVHTREEAAPKNPAAAAQRAASVPLMKPRHKLGDVAGMADLKAQLLPFIEAFKNYSKAKEASDRNGLLLSGPPGNGKTYIAEAIAGELGLPMLKVTTDMVTSQWLGMATEKVAALVAQAKECAPVVLFFDEFDALGPRRDAGNQHEETAKVVNTLLQAIDGLRSHKVVLVAATNFYDKLDPALIRDGRFDFRIEIPYPDYEARLAIIRGLSKEIGVPLPESDIDELAKHWVERSAAFITGAFKRVRASAKRGSAARAADLKAAGREASRRETAIPKDCLDVASMHLTAETRTEVDALIYAMRNWEEVVARGGSAPKGVLLYGPPGTGKTSLTRAVAKTLGDCHMFEVKTAEVLADPRKFKEVIDRAREHRPAIVFLDEADELLRDRSYSTNATATNEILKAMDGMMAAVPEVVFFAATNNVQAIDAAAMRGGRFADRIYMGLFTGADLETFVSGILKRRTGMQLAAGVNAKSIAEVIQEAGAADIQEIVSKAVNYTLSARRPVELADIARARTAILG